MRGIYKKYLLIAGVIEKSNALNAELMELNTIEEFKVKHDEY